MNCLYRKEIALTEIRNYERESLSRYKFMLLDSFLGALTRSEKLLWLQKNSYLERVPVYRGTTLGGFTDLPNKTMNFTGVITKALSFAGYYSTRTCQTAKLSKNARLIAKRFQITPDARTPILITIAFAEKYSQNLEALYETIVWEGSFSINEIDEEDFICRELTQEDFNYPYLV